MSKKVVHPGFLLNQMMNERGLTQRELASKIDIAHSHLNNILNCSRDITVNIALSLESASFENADFWLKKQMIFSLEEAKNNRALMEKNKLIQTWNELDNWLPVSYFRKSKALGIDGFEDLDKIYSLYGVKDFEGLKNKVKKYNLTYFRKSSKFAENEKNVIAWSIVAEKMALEEPVNPFNPKRENELISEIKKCFNKNKNTIESTKQILKKYGIKFFVLDRPPKTPVEGKSFISDKNPAIILTLKYKRLDNFAFTLMHELGHVFLHLTKKDYKDANFFINNAKMKKEEFEADSYAQNHLIPLEIWNEFMLEGEFDDASIFNFAKKINVHPAIVRGRVCFENIESYRKRSAINSLNDLDQ